MCFHKVGHLRLEYVADGLEGVFMWLRDKLNLAHDTLVFPLEVRHNLCPVYLLRLIVFIIISLRRFEISLVPLPDKFHLSDQFIQLCQCIVLLNLKLLTIGFRWIVVPSDLFKELLG